MEAIDLKAIVKAIDAVFGAGYAKANPELVGDYLRAQALRDLDETLAGAVGQISFKLF